MNRCIRYAIHRDEGYVVSEVGQEIAWPVLDYTAIGTDGDFTGPLRYDLERFPRLNVWREYPRLCWTRKIPIAIKNQHRAFWGMRPLPEAQP